MTVRTAFFAMMSLSCRAALAGTLALSSAGCWLIVGVNGAESAPPARDAGNGGAAAGTGGASVGANATASASGGGSSGALGANGGAGSAVGAMGGMGGGAAGSSSAGPGGAPPMGVLSPVSESDSGCVVNESGTTFEMWRSVDDPVGSPDGDATYVETALQNGTDCYHTTVYPMLPGTVSGLTVHVIATGASGAACKASIELYTTSSLLGTGSYGSTFGADGVYEDRAITAQLKAPQTNAGFRVKLHVSNTTGVGACRYTQVYIEGVP